ncbi:MAG TPA: hypothetical protein VHP34_05970 [Alphaproteobacteria bacterium]|nr:hypothetical protein [Alphaproteobacteria bacterium]
MGLVTLLLLGAFTLLYLSKSISKKPEALEKAVQWLQDNMRYLALGGVIYGFVAFCLTPIAGALTPIDMCVRMWANLLLVAMALPYCFDVLVSKYREKINAAILEETRGVVTWVSTNEKIFGFVGGATCILLFVAVFGHM